MTTFCNSILILSVSSRSTSSMKTREISLMTSTWCKMSMTFIPQIRTNNRTPLLKKFKRNRITCMHNTSLWVKKTLKTTSIKLRDNTILKTIIILDWLQSKRTWNSYKIWNEERMSWESNKCTVMVKFKKWSLDLWKEKLSKSTHSEMFWVKSIRQLSQNLSKMLNCKRSQRMSLRFSLILLPNAAKKVHPLAFQMSLTRLITTWSMETRAPPIWTIYGSLISKIHTLRISTVKHFSVKCLFQIKLLTWLKKNFMIDNQSSSLNLLFRHHGFQQQDIYSMNLQLLYLVRLASRVSNLQHNLWSKLS